MRKKVTVVLFSLLYILLVIGLMALQALTIHGVITSVLANGITIVLAAPAVFFLKIWLGEQPEEKEDITQQESRDIADLEVVFMEQMQAAGLSAREREVAWLIYRGYSNYQIGEELYISETTVKKHASHIYEKLNITGRKDLKSRAIHT